MPSRFVCLIVMCGLAAAGCNTTAQLADPRPATVPAGAATNRPPTAKIEGASASGVAVGSRLTLSANVYDPDGDKVTLAWTASAGTFSGAATPRTIWTAPSTPTTLTITLRVTDSAGASATDTVSLVVQATP